MRACKRIPFRESQTNAESGVSPGRNVGSSFHGPRGRVDSARTKHQPAGMGHSRRPALGSGSGRLMARPITGGVAFENFELRERFYDGQNFIFGITSRTPQEIGLKK